MQAGRATVNDIARAVIGAAKKQLLECYDVTWKDWSLSAATRDEEKCYHSIAFNQMHKHIMIRWPQVDLAVAKIKATGIHLVEYNEADWKVWLSEAGGQPKLSLSFSPLSFSVACSVRLFRMSSAFAFSSRLFRFVFCFLLFR